HGDKAPSVEEGVELLLGILAGLEHLHQAGIIHRDVKPANVLLHKGVPRLTDFGLSRCLASGTHASAVEGTPAFMAPEAFDGICSEASDVWSVGVLAHLLLTGDLPFPGREWTTLFQAIVSREPTPLPDHVPEPVRAVIRLSLEKDVTRRLSSAGRMAEMLRHTLRDTAGRSHAV